MGCNNPVSPVSKPTKVSLVREVKDGDANEFKRRVKKVKTSTTTYNLKLWLTTFFQPICGIMPMCVNENGSTNHYFPSWFTKEIVLNEYIKDTESRIKGRSFAPSSNRKYQKKTVRETFVVEVIKKCENSNLQVHFFLS